MGAQCEDLIEGVRPLIEDFIQRNARFGTTIAETECVIEKLWGDKSIFLDIRKVEKFFLANRQGAKLLEQVLQGVVLPDHIRAIAHMNRVNDSSPAPAIEFIYTFKPNEESSQMNRERYTYIVNSTTAQNKVKLTAHFGPGSINLAFFTWATQIKGESAKEYVNLGLLRQNSLGFLFEKSKDLGITIRNYEDIIELLANPDFLKMFSQHLYSFWLHFDDEEYFKSVIDDMEIAHKLFRNINFHLLKYDRETPLIVLEDPSYNDTLLPDLSPKPWGNPPSPAIITDIDEHVYNYVSKARESYYRDPFSLFINAYQAIEHMAFYMGDQELRNDIRKILAKYDAYYRLKTTVDDVLSLMGEFYKRRVDKRESLSIAFRTADLSKHKPLHNIIRSFNELDKYFLREQEFEGGFILKPLMRDSSSAEIDTEVLADNLSKIRNALMHVKDHKSSTTILPTHKNGRVLYPYSILSFEIAVYLADFYSKYYS